MKRFTIFGILFLGLLLPVSAACKKQHKAVPADPLIRADLFASHLPADAEMLVVIPRVKVFREKANTLKETLGDSSVTGVVDRFQKQFQKAFGINFLDETSWRNAGLSPDSSLGVAMYRDRPIIYLFVDNRQKFEQTIVHAMENAFQFKGVAKNTKVGNYEVKFLSDDPAKQLAWLYDGKMVMLTMPSLSNTGALEAGSATLVLTSARGVKAEDSFKTLKSYTKYRGKYLNKYPLAALVPTENYLKNPDVQKRIQEQQNGKEAEVLIRKYLEYFVAVADFKGQRILSEVFIGGNDQFKGTVKTLSKMEVVGDWEPFVTENLGLGIRLTADPEGAFGFIKASMAEKDRRLFQRRIQGYNDKLGIDVEKDLIAASTGQLGIYFYGIAGNAMALASGNINTILNKTGLMVSLQFKSAEALDTLTQKLVTSSKGEITIAEAKKEDGTLLEGLHSISIPSLGFPIRILTYKNRLVVSTPALGEEAIYGYITATRKKDKRITEVEGFDLGTEFATTKLFNGMYANFHRLKNNPGQILAMLGAGFLIESFEEMQFKIAPEEDGLKVSFIGDLNPVSIAPKEKK